MPIKERRTDVHLIKRIDALETQIIDNTVITNKALDIATKTQENTATLIELAKWVVTTRKIVLWVGALIVAIGSALLVLKNWIK